MGEGVPTPAYSFSRSISMMAMPDGAGGPVDTGEAEHQSSGLGVSMAAAAAAAVASLPSHRWQRVPDVPSRSSSFGGAASAAAPGRQGESSSPLVMGCPSTQLPLPLPLLPPAAVPPRTSLCDMHHASGSVGSLNATRTGSGVLVRSCLAPPLGHSMSSTGLAAMVEGLTGAGGRGGSCTSPQMTAQVCASLHRQSLVLQVLRPCPTPGQQRGLNDTAGCARRMGIQQFQQHLTAVAEVDTVSHMFVPCLCRCWTPAPR